MQQHLLLRPVFPTHWRVLRSIPKLHLVQLLLSYAEPGLREWTKKIPKIQTSPTV